MGGCFFFVTMFQDKVYCPRLLFSSGFFHYGYCIFFLKVRFLECFFVKEILAKIIT